MQDYEKLGAFYLGKRYELEDRQLTDDLLLYDSKDLTTHAVCVGMTGSGKTGLCLSLLEEAAIDGIPAIIVDPKGDLANLMLTFPQLRTEDFRPWIDESEAARRGQTPDEFAAATANLWRQGLADWGQPPERIERFRNAADVAVYTPASNAGISVTVLRSFDAPPPEVLNDADAYRERISSATAGLLALLGVKGDAIQSREHILISNILDSAWREGRSLDLAGLIHNIQSPTFERIGVFDLETYFPAKDRTDLAMQLNNLLASPTFANWLEGEPLDIRKLLHTENGRPRLAILLIAHLSESERMFFVTILLNEVLAWIRTQPGTSSLRALLYMDEIFGYFPPTANPPSKQPMLTLLKQARAFGLGVVLATQNPVDLDYKGLSNTGTWFLGRLQTERDKARVLEGLEGASAQAGAEFDRGKMEQTLAGLGKRVFLMNNVHEDEPVVFQTRWVLSYLRGPMTRQQISKLMADRKPAGDEKPAATQSIPAPASPRPAPPPPPPTTTSSAKPAAPRPVLPADVDEAFLYPTTASGNLIYRPALLGQASLHFVRSSYKVDSWEDRCLLAPLADEDNDDPWEEAQVLASPPKDVDRDPEPGAGFGEIPAELSNKRSYSSWQKRLKDHLYQHEVHVVWKCPVLKEYSEPGESEGDFRIRLTHAARERRDLEVEKLRNKYGSKRKTLQDRLRTAEAAVQRETSQYKRAKTDSVISFGSSILGALFGRKVASRTNVSRAGSSLRKAGRASEQYDDIERAQAKVKAYQEELMELDRRLDEEVTALQAEFDVDSLELEPMNLPPRKSDLNVDDLTVLWLPWSVDERGRARPAYELK